MAKILGVDDSPEVLQQLQILLTSFGHDFSFIAQPKFLFKRLEEEQFDLVLMDMNMPDINGMQLLKMLKKNEAFNDIPVIMITADDDVELLRDCFHAGASDFIAKPLHEVVLRARVEAVLNIREKIREIVSKQEKIRRQELEIERQRTLHYQLRSLSASMDPHFIFNSLNAVQYFILDNEVDAAMDFIADFSSLMRISLYNSTKPFISLSDEAEFLQAYLKVEQRRLSKAMTFRVSLPAELNEYRIPPMLIQPYVENAILHGILNKKGSGNVSVLFIKKGETICCEVKDDGVGREEAMKIRDREKSGNRQSMAMGITQARLDLFNALEKNAFSVEITDMKDSGKITGTSVTISFPADL